MNALGPISNFFYTIDENLKVYDRNDAKKIRLSKDRNGAESIKSMDAPRADYFASMKNNFAKAFARVPRSGVSGPLDEVVTFVGRIKDLADTATYVVVGAVDYVFAGPTDSMPE